MTNGWDNQPNEDITRTIQELSDSVKKLTHSVERMSQSGGSSRVPKKGADDKGWKDLKDTFEGVIRETLPKKKDGQLYKNIETKLDSILNKYNNAFKEIYNITEFGYNRDNPSNRVNAFNTDASLDLLNKILSEFNGARGFQNNTQQNRQALLQGHDLALVKDTYRYQPAEGNNHEAIVRYTGTLSQVRDAVVVQTAVLNNIHQALTNNNSAQSSTNHTQVNNSLNAIAANSQLVRDALKSLEKSVNKSTSTVDKFYDKIKTTATNLTTINRRLSGSATSLQNIGKKLSGVSKSLNGTQKKLGAIGSASASSKNNSFREQATRNSDRAKQAGFIALLIPALAKLLKKSPMTDLLKLLFLRLGATHPMLAAAGLMASPFITGTIFAPVAQRMLSGIFGIGGHLRGTRNVRVPGVRSRIPLSQTFKYTQGAFAGVTHADNTKMYSIVHRRHLGLAEPIIDPSTGRELRDDSGLLRLRGKTENIAGNLGYLQGRQWARNMRRIWQPKFLLPRFGRAVGSNFRNMTRGVPLLGTTIGAMFELPDIINAGKSGKKGALANQLGKSTGGIAGGTLGAALGGAIGTILGPIGTMVGATLGGIIGDKAGRTIGPSLAKGFKGTFDGLKKYLSKLGRDTKKLGQSLGKAGTAIGHVLSPIIYFASRIVSSTLNAILKVTLGLLDGIVIGLTKMNNVITKVCDGITWACEKLGTSITDLELALLNMPLLGPGIRAIAGATPEGKNRVNDLAAQSGPGTPLFEDRKKELVAQYYRANTPSISGTAKSMVEAYNRGAGIKGMLKAGANGVGNWKNIDQNAKDWAEKQLLQQAVPLRGGVSSTGGPTGKGTFYNHAITSAYGYRIHPTKGGRKFHDGIDLAFRKGEKVGAYAGGRIAKVGWEKGYGNVVVVESTENGRKVYHRYAHLQNAAKGLKVGQAVGVGSVLGFAGSSGDSSGPHLHYEQRWDSMWGKSRNPMVSMSSSIKEYNENLKKSKAEEASNKKAITETAELGSGIREAFRELVGGGKGGSSKQDRTRNIVLSAVDVTGSLGVWGITQYNNGVMSK